MQMPKQSLGSVEASRLTEIILYAFCARRCPCAARVAGRGAGGRAGGTCARSEFHIGRFRASASSDNATYLAGRERIVEGMRMAEVPER